MMNDTVGQTIAELEGRNPPGRPRGQRKAINTISIGYATLLFDSHAQAWVKPGGGVILDREHARRYTERTDAEMRRVGGDKPI